MTYRIAVDVSEAELERVALVFAEAPLGHRTLESWLAHRLEDAGRLEVLLLVARGEKLRQLAVLQANGEIEIGRPTTEEQISSSGAWPTDETLLPGEEAA